MKKLYQEFLEKIDIDAFIERTVNLCKIEMGQTSTHQYKAAQYTLEQIKAAGIPNAELLEFPADGKTAYLDKRMPIAWDATVGRLSHLIPGKEPQVIADYQKHPFHLIHASVATPPEGIITKIITEDQFRSGADVKDCLVMLNPMTDPRPAIMKPILDRGGLGLVSDYLVDRYQTPDHIQWVVACTEAGDWHVTALDRPFIGFSVSPRTGDQIRQAATKGTYKVKVECDGRRYEGILPAVTALIPGKSKKEVWILAHLFEPMLNDDCMGVMAGIEVAKQIMAKGTPDYSVRLVFAMELYGFAAYAASRGGDLKGQVIGGCNLDSMCAVYGEDDLKLCPSGYVPCIMNEVLKEVYEEFKDTRKLIYAQAEFHDDMFLSDYSTGLPTTWLMNTAYKKLWHNSRQCEPDFFNWPRYKENLAFASMYLYTVANSGGREPAPKQLTLKPVSSPWRDYAAKMVFARKEIGLPYSQVKVPRDEKVSMPDGIIYGPISNVLSNMDGKKNLAELILEAEAEREQQLSEGQVKKYIMSMNHLADYGYLEVISRPEISGDDIKAALNELGVTGDDVLMVHASVSNCGYISGGPTTLIDAIRETAGTSMFTTFTYPYILLGGSLSAGYVPFDAADPSQVWTGKVGETVLKKYPDAVRSRHITHSWAGFGKKIHECLDAHEPDAAPTGKDCPLEKAMEMGGKVLYFGTGLGPSTFLHYLEDASNLPYLDDAVCGVKMPDGSTKKYILPKHLPGDRDFYHVSPGKECKFYERAYARGLNAKRVKLGMNELILMDLQEVYKIGMEIIREDPNVLLCDDPECLFCSKFNHK